MKQDYDFSQGKRGAVVPVPASKVRITLRLDSDVVEWFKAAVHRAGGGNYQTLINDALRRQMRQEAELSERTPRRVTGRELRATG